VPILPAAWIKSPLCPLSTLFHKWLPSFPL
jgi:hypothetical protein